MSASGSKWTTCRASARNGSDSRTQKSEPAGHHRTAQLDKSAAPKVPVRRFCPSTSFHLATSPTLFGDLAKKVGEVAKGITEKVGALGGLGHPVTTSELA